MKQRGRKSADQLITDMGGNRFNLSGFRIEPPDFLSDTETAIFNEIIASVPDNHFAPGDVLLVSTLSQVAALMREATKRASSCKPAERPSAIKQVQELSKTIGTLLTKARLCPLSRSNADRAGTAARAYRPSVYDEMRVRGWSHDTDR